MEIVSVKIGSPSQATKVNIEAPEQVKVTFKDVVINNGGGSVKSVNGQTGDVLLDAAAVGALPNTTKIPANTSDLINNSGFITKTVSDLTNYYLKSETYSREKIDNKISAIPKFNIKVVTSLPTTGISKTTVYLVKSGDDSSNLYTEYIYANGKWEILGSQTIDLSGYALKSEIPTKLSELESDNGHQTIDAADRDRINQVADLPKAVKVGDATYYPNHGIIELNTVIESDGLRGDPPARALVLKHGDATYTVPVLEGWKIKPFNLPLATENDRGAMTPEQYTKLEGIEEGAEKNLIYDILAESPHSKTFKYQKTVTSPSGVTSVVDESIMVPTATFNNKIHPNYLPEVTDSANGAMTATQKKKLEQLSEEIANQRSQLDGKQPVGNYLTEVPPEYVTEDELDAEITDLKAQGVQQTPLFANSVNECTDQSKVYVLPDGYIYGYQEKTETVVIPGETVIVPGQAALVEGYRWSGSGKSFSAHTGSATVIVPTKGLSVPFDIELVNLTLSTTYGLVYGGNPTPTTSTEFGKAYGGTNSVTVNTAADCIFFMVNRTQTSGEFANSKVVVDGTETAVVVSSTTNYTNDVKQGSTTVTEDRTETVTTKGFVNTGRAFVPADYEDRIIKVEKAIENVKVEFEPADYINSVHCPVQLPANEESGADFNLHTFTGFGGEFNSYFEDLLARYPHYLVREYLGKDASGTLDMYRYVLGKHYYSAWHKENYPRMYAWKNGNTVVYSTSISPRIGDTLYSTAYIGTAYNTVTAVSATNRSRTANGLEFVRYEAGDIEPTVYYTPAYNPNNNFVSKGGSVYATGISIDGNILTVGGSNYIRYPFGDLKKDWSKPIHMTIIANEHGGDTEPAIPTVVVARLIRDLCNGQLSSDNPIYRFLRDNVQVTIIPAVNPHGLNKYAGGVFNGYYNANGVNINRNYDTVGWDYCYNHQDLDGNDKLGSYAGSENETQYVMNTMVDSKAEIAMSVHTIACNVSNILRCNYQGQNPNGAYSQSKIDEITDDMKSSYNLNFYAYAPLACPPDTTAKSPSYITQIGAYGGIVEFQCHNPLATTEEFNSRETMFTDVVMEQNYSLLLKFIAMWLSDFLEQV